MDKLAGALACSVVDNSLERDEISLTAYRDENFSISLTRDLGRDESAKIPPQAINCQNNIIVPASGIKYSHLTHT
jgi:hypothetical protein